MWDGVNLNSSVCPLKMPAWTSCEGRGAVLREDGTQAQRQQGRTCVVVMREGEGRAASKRLRALSQSVEFGLAAAPRTL